MRKKNKDKKKQPDVSSEVFEGDNAFAERTIWKFVGVVSLLACLANLYILTEIKDSAPTHLLPMGSIDPSFGGEVTAYTITAKRASNNYLRQIGTDIAQNYYAATPASARIQHNFLLSTVHPTRYTTLRDRWNKRAVQLEELKTAAIYGQIDWSRPLRHEFLPTQEYPGLKEPQSITITAQRIIFIGSSGAPAERKPTDLVIEYVIENGRFWLLDIKEEKTRV